MCTNSGPEAVCSACPERMRFRSASWSMLLGVGRADALLNRVLEHSARRGPNGCASGAGPGALCSASAERMRLWSASWSILLCVCRADALLELVAFSRLPSECKFRAPKIHFSYRTAARMRIGILEAPGGWSQGGRGWSGFRAEYDITRGLVVMVFLYEHSLPSVCPLSGADKGTPP